MSKIDYDRIEGDVVYIGEKSIRFFSYDLDDHINIPLSCLPIGEEPAHKQNDVTIRVASWFCKKEGLG